MTQRVINVIYVSCSDPGGFRSIRQWFSSNKSINNEIIINFGLPYETSEITHILLISPDNSTSTVIETVLAYVLFSGFSKVILWCDVQSIADGKFGKTFSEILQLCAPLGVKFATYKDCNPEIEELYETIVNMNPLI